MLEEQIGIFRKKGPLGYKLVITRCTPFRVFVVPEFVAGRYSLIEITSALLKYRPQAHKKVFTHRPEMYLGVSIA